MPLGFWWCTLCMCRSLARSRFKAVYAVVLRILNFPAGLQVCHNAKAAAAAAAEAAAAAAIAPGRRHHRPLLSVQPLCGVGLLF